MAAITIQAKQEIAILAELIRDPVIRTWQAIGPDVMAVAYEVSGDEWLEDDVAMEAVLDANRMSMYGGKDGKTADEMVREAVLKFGWSNVVTELSKIINL